MPPAHSTRTAQQGSSPTAAQVDDFDSPVAKRALKKAQWRLMPFLLLLYFVNYLDRNNVGFAKLQMGQDLGLSSSIYGLGAGIFFVAYFLLELPSNAGMMRFGARLWIARILIVWGLVAAAMAWVRGPTSYIAMRLLLGASEAGFFPGVIFYMTLWFPARIRVGMLGMFIIAQPLSNGLGAPFSGWLLQLGGIWGLAGWQWLFILQGLPAALLGVATLFWLPNGPEDARWLSSEEKHWLKTTLDKENQLKSSHGKRFWDGLKHPSVLALAAIYFAISFAIYGLSLWMPTIVEHFGGLSTVQVGLLVMIPYAFAVPTVYFWTRHADRTQERVWHTALPMLFGGLAMAVSAYTVAIAPVAGLAALTLAACGLYACLPPFWELPASLLSGATAASGIAAINSLGSLAGFVAPYSVGLLSEATGNHRLGLLIMAAVVIGGGIFAAIYGHRRHLGQVRP